MRLALLLHEPVDVLLAGCLLGVPLSTWHDVTGGGDVQLGIRNEVLQLVAEVLKLLCLAVGPTAQHDAGLSVRHDLGRCSFRRS